MFVKVEKITFENINLKKYEIKKKLFSLFQSHNFCEKIN